MRRLICILIIFFICFSASAALTGNTSASVNLKLNSSADKIEVGFSNGAVSSESDFPVAFPSSGIPLVSAISGNTLTGTASGWVYWKIVSSDSIRISLTKSKDLEHDGHSIPLNVTWDGKSSDVIHQKTSGLRDASSEAFNLSAQITDLTATGENSVHVGTYVGELTLRVEVIS